MLFPNLINNKTPTLGALFLGAIYDPINRAFKRLRHGRLSLIFATVRGYNTEKSYNTLIEKYY